MTWKKKRKRSVVLDGQIRERTYTCHLTNLNDKTHCELGCQEAVRKPWLLGEIYFGPLNMTSCIGDAVRLV